MNTARVPEETGLSQMEAARRLVECGRNELEKEQPKSPWRLLLDQFLSPLIGLLVLASAISWAMDEWLDAIAIACILVINGLVGFFQEYRAERAMAALRSLTAPRARVLRDGASSLIPAADVVPGDILLLEAGDIVAADARVTASYALEANEASLTGESMSVEKAMTPDSPSTPLAERHNTVHMGTSIVGGTGAAVVIATGSRTELGKIARLLQSVSEGPTPLQARLEKLSHLLIGLCLAVVAVVALVGLVQGQSWQNVLISAVSLAVAAVPEGLPAVVTIALALGMQRMSVQRVLVRRLHAIETIGCTTVICTDKTGTLTAGAMSVREVVAEDKRALLFAAAACCDAELAPSGGGVGDPTEVALLIAAREQGIERAALEADVPRVAVLPFDSSRKRMAIQRSDGILYVKGAPESVFQQATYLPPGVVEAATAMAARGLRVLTIATGRMAREEELTVLGLVGISDPPRPEAIAAVSQAQQAGVRTVMITGDHPVTAKAIALEMGIIRPDESARDWVHARATPEDKLRIVREWKARGAMVAMTGDGVNDAPALREAHVGIAMGITGTEVTREAADLILTDDNFASIVAALREGRGIFDNIRKTVAYLLAGNVGELAVMLGAALLALPFPLLPLHILWINLATDGLPALALAAEPTDPAVLSRPPRRPTDPLLGRQEWVGVVLVGFMQAGLTLAVFAWALEARGLEQARNLAFTSLVFGELFRSFGARSADKTIFELGFLTNGRLFAVVVASVIAQLLIHHVPAFEAALQIAPLSIEDCLLSFAIGSVPLLVLEAWKVGRRKLRSSQKKVT
ncbi:cation-translocating P-type ATPase [Pseudoduganella sp. OTU4001]|uniref:cation-translocating P-type ATPase n=1 Tax=Pseudoduganella sp. OTU4001 TaxID=3043854 RepID=UPI00313BD9A4